MTVTVNVTVSASISLSVSVTHLQAQLLFKLRSASSLQDWLAKAPCGLDLEHCMRDAAARNLLLSSPALCKILLQDSRTAVASENTCLALVRDVGAAAGGPVPRDLLRCVRWGWLGCSYLPRAAEVMPHLSVFQC